MWIRKLKSCCLLDLLLIFWFEISFVFPDSVDSLCHSFYIFEEVDFAFSSVDVDDFGWKFDDFESEPLCFDDNFCIPAPAFFFDVG